MASLISKRILIVLLFFLVLSGNLFVCFPVLGAGSSSIDIVNVQTISNNGQSCFFFRRGFDVVGFNVTISNNGSFALSGQLVVSILDNTSVPVGELTSSSFSISVGNTSTIQVFSNTIPNYAYVGLANATVIVEDLSKRPVCFQTVNFYIHAFSLIAVTPSISSVTAGDSVNYDATAYDANGNNLDIKTWVNWSTNNSAQGSWSGNIYFTAKAGSWDVIASLGSSLNAHFG